jgi:hypothetical protein
MESVKKFVAVSYGSGYGSDYGSGTCGDYDYDKGDGYGSGYGYDYDYGKGDGYGSGYGKGDGKGSGIGSGYGIASYDGRDVHLIDDVQTIITAVFGGAAKGYILETDLTLTPCYVAKSGNTFAHGNTLKEAIDALHEKLFDDMPEEDRIAEFFKAHSPGVKYPAKDLFVWHNRLTGSCEAGRMSFVRSHDIDLENDTFTIEEFVSLCKDSYGGETIKKLLG